MVKRRGSKEGNGARRKQGSTRRSRKSAISKVLSFLRENSSLVAIAGVVAAAVLLASTVDFNDDHDGTRGNEDGGPRSDKQDVPHVDGVAMDLDPERGNKTEEFLDGFVCGYRPDSGVDVRGEAPAAGDAAGYCHPRLSAVPQHRTQRVSVQDVGEGPNWWRKVVRRFTNGKGGSSSPDLGIKKGELVMRLPRPLQIWDLDALRDKFIQQEFLGLGSSKDQKGPRSVARHKDTQNPLDSGAYLTVYLIRLFHGSRSSSANLNDAGECPNEDNDECFIEWEDVDQHKDRIALLSPYLDILPTTSDRLAPKFDTHSHPIMWPVSDMKSFFPANTPTNDLINNYQRMIRSEYEALADASARFRKSVTSLEYMMMRINVLSRAFGLPATEGDGGVQWGTTELDKKLSLGDELSMYETSNFGSSLDSETEKEFKLRSMCPLLDMYNSHPNPNVSWRYDAGTSSYLIHASPKGNIPPGHSIVVSYGKYTDNHLFAKYAYVNGDGSSPTEISLAVFHRMVGDVGLGRQFSLLPFDDRNERDETASAEERRSPAPLIEKSLDMQAQQLVGYLIFDDGYGECVDASADPGSRDVELKLLKLKHLIRIANRREAWIVRLPPRLPDAAPLQALGTKRDVMQEKKVGINAKRIISVCRLISLRPDDVDGGAIEYLREGLASYDSPTSSKKPFFMVEKHGHELEYRAMMCVVRLCNIALNRYKHLSENAEDDDSRPQIVGSKEWNAWYVTSGEVRALHILYQTASGEAKRMKGLHRAAKGAAGETDESMIIREEGACPVEYSSPLLSRL